MNDSLIMVIRVGPVFNETLEIYVMWFECGEITFKDQIILWHFTLCQLECKKGHKNFNLIQRLTTLSLKIDQQTLISNNLLVPF